MMVTKEEIVEALTSRYSTPWFRVLAAKIESEGIAPKPYVPMTNAELNALDYTGSNIAETVQWAVIERAGLEIKHD